MRARCIDIGQGKTSLRRMRINFRQTTMTAGVICPFQSGEGIERRSAGITGVAPGAQSDSISIRVWGFEESDEQAA